MRKKYFLSANADVYPGMTAKNRAVMDYENFIQETFYPCIIHPYSVFRVNWEKVICVMILLRLTFVPFLWATFQENDLIFQLVLLFFQLVAFADVCCNFFTGYVQPRTEHAVLNPRKIAKNYLLTYFIVDVITCWPNEFVLIVVRPSWCFQVEYKIQSPLDPEPCHIVQSFFYFSSTLQLCAFFRYFFKLGKLYLINIFIMYMISIVITFYCLVFVLNSFYQHYYTTGACFICLFENTPMFKRNSTMPMIDEFLLYCRDFIEAVTVIVTECVFEGISFNTSTLPIRILISLCTFFYSIGFTVYIYKYITVRMQAKRKTIDFEHYLFTFAKARRLPLMLKHKLFLYFLFLQENKHYKEGELFNYIPDTYRADIFYQLCLPLLKYFHAFEDLPTYIMRRLAEALIYQLYLPNDTILQRNASKLAMYFVFRGTVALYSSQQIELYHFQEGGCFNGRNLVLGERTTNHYAIAVEVAEVYRLEEDSFKEIMRTYPALYESVKRKVINEQSGSSYLLA